MEEKKLSLKDLANILNALIEEGNLDEKSVEIPLQDASIGPVKGATIVACGVGFDWNSGRIFLYPKENLVSYSYMQDCLYGNWHPYPKYKPRRPGIYWVTIEDGDTPVCMETETLKHPDSTGNYPFYCTKKITAWKERIVPNPYHE